MVERGVGDTQSGETLNDKQVLDMLMSKYWLLPSLVVDSSFFLCIQERELSWYGILKSSPYRVL